MLYIKFLKQRKNKNQFSTETIKNQLSLSKKKKELLFELNKIWGVIKEAIGKIKCNNQKN